jgi:hypothetical protein
MKASEQIFPCFHNITSIYTVMKLAGEQSAAKSTTSIDLSCGKKQKKFSYGKIDLRASARRAEAFATPLFS